MIKLFRKLFIKDYLNITNENVRNAHGKMASIVGIISNILLFIAKLFIGILSNSIAIIADSINNLADSSSSLITLVGFKLSSKPADKDHPYGHQRIEYIAGLMVSMIIIFVGFQLGYSSVNKIINNESVKIEPITIIILTISIIVKLWQSLFYKKVGKLINSLTLIVTSTDSRNDVITTIFILIGCIITFFIPNIPFSVDGVLGVLVSIFILYSGFNMIKSTTDPLIGVSADQSTIKQIVSEIESYEMVLGTHDVVCHLYGPSKVFMTVHVEIPQDESVLVIHEIIDNIEHEIFQRYGVELTIHMDPIDNKSEYVNNLKKEIITVLRELDSQISIHDFRIVKGKSHTNLIFDILLPVDFKLSEESIILVLKEKMNTKSRKFFFVVDFDRNFMGAEQ